MEQRVGEGAILSPWFLRVKLDWSPESVNYILHTFPLESKLQYLGVRMLGLKV
jgi:hypothetical protein